MSTQAKRNKKQDGARNAVLTNCGIKIIFGDLDANVRTLRSASLHRA